MDVSYEVLSGDPDLADRKGRQYQEIARAIRDSVLTLDAVVAQTDQKSEAMTATRDLARDVADDIRKATKRYQATGDALVTYASELRRTQDASRTIVTEIGEIEADLAVWRDRESSRKVTYDGARLAGDETALETARTRYYFAEDRVVALETSLEAQRRLWDEQRDDKVIAAATAASAISEVVEGEGGQDLNDGFWDHVGVVVEILKVICDIAAILSIFLAWVPVLGQLLLILAAIGAIISVLDAAIKWANGEGSFGEFLGALALGVLTLFGGKLLGYLAKGVHRGIVLALPAGTKMTKASRSLMSVVRSTPSYNKGILGFLRSPFTRSVADVRRFQAFQKGVPFSKLLAHAAAQGNPFKLRNLAKFDGDVADLFTAVGKLEITDVAVLAKTLSLYFAESGYAVYKNVDALQGLQEAFADGVDVGAVAEAVEEGADRLAGPISKTVKEVAGMIADAN